MNHTQKSRPNYSEYEAFKAQLEYLRPQSFYSGSMAKSIADGLKNAPQMYNEQKNYLIAIAAYKDSVYKGTHRSDKLWQALEDIKSYKLAENMLKEHNPAVIDRKPINNYIQEVIDTLEK